MPTILLIESHPILRQRLSEILSNGHADRRILEIDRPDLAGLAPNAGDVDLAVLSAGGGAPWLKIIGWIIRYFQPPAILAMIDAHTRPLDLNKLPAIVTCISDAVTSEILKAYVNLLLAGGVYSVLRPYTLANHIMKNQQASGDRQPISEPQSVKAAPLPHSSASKAEESELLGLTPRQYEVLILLSKGYPIKLVAQQMNISAATVKAHAEAMYQRLNVKSRNEAVYEAISRGASLSWTSSAIKVLTEQHSK